MTRAGLDEMKPPEIFTTERLRLRPPSVSDAETVYNTYATDTEVTRYLMWQPHKSIEETRAFLKRITDG